MKRNAAPAGGGAALFKLPGWRPGESKEHMLHTTTPPPLQAAQASRADGPQPQKIALEKAAAELGTTPYWLRRELRHHGLAVDKFTDHRSLIKALGEKLKAKNKAEQAAREQRRAEVALAAAGRTFTAKGIARAERRPITSRPGSAPNRAAQAFLMRQRDSELRGWRQEGPTQNISHQPPDLGTAQAQAAASRERQKTGWQPARVAFKKIQAAKSSIHHLPGLVRGWRLDNETAIRRSMGSVPAQGGYAHA